MAASTALAVFAIIIALVGSVIGMASPAPSGISCSNPPPNNPNSCHVYTWKSFPNDNTNIPKTGMFSNDTSYYFAFNQTSIVSFSICANFVATQGDGNFTLFLQYTNDGVSWLNVDQSTNGDGGSIGPLGLSLPQVVCSLSLGKFPSTGLTCALAGLGQCEFRIAGSSPLVQCTVFPNCSLSISELFIQFYFTSFAAKNTITCSATSISTTGFTNTCARPLATASDSLTVKWEANLLGVGFQGGSVTCSFSAGANTCTNTVSFSPSFATAPSVFESQSKTLGTGTVTGGDSSILPILT